MWVPFSSGLLPVGIGIRSVLWIMPLGEVSCQVGIHESYAGGLIRLERGFIKAKAGVSLGLRMGFTKPKAGV